jgi:hypothetical protein
MQPTTGVLETPGECRAAAADDLGRLRVSEALPGDQNERVSIDLVERSERRQELLVVHHRGSLCSSFGRDDVSPDLFDERGLAGLGPALVGQDMSGHGYEPGQTRIRHLIEVTTAHDESLDHHIFRIEPTRTPSHGVGKHLGSVLREEDL